MDQKITLGQYITSKDQLLEAIQCDPIHEVTYEIYKYCRIVTGENKKLKEYHNLKPKQQLKVKWRYTDIEGIPTPIAVTIPHLAESIKEGIFSTFKSGESMLKWLRTNAREVS